ncbi:UNC-50 protein [Linderina pennispora]|uniref:UNC-50 protein n=1 Tax=Linderina pennispora TaxID=61395 RepID=A0A1Y1WEY1_9FUNG|nr:UNC-50 protein [Linderina pennispora]ORX72053.1 UNC-50 protein [Linderina pennispora]
MSGEPVTILPESTDFRPRMRRRLRRIHRSAILRRLLHWRQLDFEFASWQMLYLIVSPKRVYRNIYYHKQTKNQWARDDPAFVLLLVAGICAITCAYSVVYEVGMAGFLKALVQLLVVNFVVSGLILATASWVTGEPVSAAPWQYAFDVHCNGFFVFFVMAYVLQFFFLPVLMKTSWISLFLGNTVFALAGAGYAYVTYLGFQAMPFLQHQEVFLYLVPLVAVVYLASLFGFNVSHHVIDYYF